MPQESAPMDQLRGEPLRFLETEQFQEMLSVYRKLKPLEQENPRKFRNQLNTYDFSDIYPIMDTYLQTRALSDPEAVSAVIAEAAPESVAFASTLLDIFETTVAERVQEYDVLGNSPATYFICGVWANMKRGREFHPASNGITVTYDQPDAYGNQNIRYRNKDYEMTHLRSGGGLHEKPQLDGPPSADLHPDAGQRRQLAEQHRHLLHRGIHGVGGPEKPGRGLPPAEKRHAGHHRHEDHRRILQKIL